MADPFEAIRAHLEKHAGKERATFSIAGVKALLDEVDSRLPLTMPDAKRRQLFISHILANNGHFNRSDICETFSVSKPQASIDIARWLEANPGAVTYNRSAKRYEADTK